MTPQGSAGPAFHEQAREQGCPICGGTEFGPAPNGRLSQRGRLPLCLGCKSLERHRAGRALMEIIRDRELFKQCSLLQFGEPGIVAKGWFRSVESGRSSPALWIHRRSPLRMAASIALSAAT
jgi:hypothetical protein